MGNLETFNYIRTYATASPLTRSLVIGVGFTGNMLVASQTGRGRTDQWLSSATLAPHSSTTPTSIPAQVSDPQHAGMNKRAIIGLCIGVAIMSLALLGLVCYRRHRKSRFGSFASPNIEKRPLNKRSAATLSHRREISTDDFDFGGLVPTVQPRSRFSLDGENHPHDHIPVPDMQDTNMPRNYSPTPVSSRNITPIRENSATLDDRHRSPGKYPYNDRIVVTGLSQSFHNYPPCIPNHSVNSQSLPRDNPLNSHPRRDIIQHPSREEFPRSQSAMALRPNGPLQQEVLRSESAMNLRNHQTQRIHSNFPFNNSARQQRLVVNRHRPIGQSPMFPRKVSPPSPPPTLQPSPSRSPGFQSTHCQSTPPVQVMKQGRRASPPSPLCLPPILPSTKDDTPSPKNEDFSSRDFALPQVSPTTSPPKIPTPALPSAPLSKSPSVHSIVSTSSSILDQHLQPPLPSPIPEEMLKPDSPTPVRTPSLAARTAWAEKRKLLKGFLNTKDQIPVPAIPKSALSTHTPIRSSYNSPTENMFNIYGIEDSEFKPTSQQA